jgi:hypothetical protein
VYDLTLSRDGRGVYVGGDFSRLDRGSRRDLGEVDARTGALTNWNPQANGGVDVITVARSRVYVGGTFTSIGGKSRRATAVRTRVLRMRPRGTRTWSAASTRCFRSETRFTWEASSSRSAERSARTWRQSTPREER